MDKQSEQTVATNTVRAILHESYEKPAKVLRLGTVADAGAPEKDSVRVRLTHRPIHPGDPYLVEGATLSGSAPAIEPEAPRVPGFEGSGVIDSVGPEAAHRLGIGSHRGRFRRNVWCAWWRNHGSDGYHIS